jgi:hypothetical protein
MRRLLPLLAPLLAAALFSFACDDPTTPNPVADDAAVDAPSEAAPDGGDAGD